MFSNRSSCSPGVTSIGANCPVLPTFTSSIQISAQAFGMETLIFPFVCGFSGFSGCSFTTEGVVSLIVVIFALFSVIFFVFGFSTVSVFC